MLIAFRLSRLFLDALLNYDHKKTLSLGMVAENCQSKNPYFEGRVVLFVIIFSFELYILFYFSNLFILILN